MKRILLSVLIICIIILSTLLSGCGKTEAPEASESTEAVSETGTAPAVDSTPALVEPETDSTAAPDTEPARTEVPETVPETEFPETVPETETELETEPAPETEPAETEPEETEPEETEPPLTPEQLARLAFYDEFWELDPEATDRWLEAHPEVFSGVYAEISVNEAWLSDSGLDLYTKNGHQVLAIDAENHILIIRAWLGRSRAVMAIAKDSSRLHLYPASTLGSHGERIDTIARRHDGLLAMTGSGFDDPGGNGNGGTIAGYCMCGGRDYGRHFGWNYARFELLENNWAFVTHADGSVSQYTTDAMEFEPALLIDGEFQDPGIWTGENPRACIGQTWRKEILMVGVEGRYADSPGCSVVKCAELMKAYGCTNAINCDGGTTAIIWYRGEPIMRCSNRSTPGGRYLPNAWVYVKGND